MLTWFLNPKNAMIAALGICLLALGIWFTLLKIDLNIQKGKVIEQKTQIDQLAREKEILNQNAIAAREAEARMKKIVAAATDLQGMIDNIPEVVKRGLQNETMERINHCVGAFFNNGVLPKDCIGIAVLPQPASPKVGGGSGQLPGKL